MINKKTVLILGAGASVDLGYPTGTGLIELIHSHRTTPFKNSNDPNEPSYYLEENFEDFYNVFSKVPILNIDSYLRDNPRHETSGKQLIVYALLLNENPIEARMESFIKLRQTSSWLLYLYNAIIRGCYNDGEVLKSLSNIQIITFNYDVSVEAFFLNQFSRQERFEKIATELMERLTIIHIYGQLYYLNDEKGKWSLSKYAIYQKQKGRGPLSDNALINYQTYQRAIACAHNIHAIGEHKQNTLAQSEHIKRAKLYLKEAEAVYVLGFSFDSDNLDLLSDTAINWPRKKILYTNYDKSEQLQQTATSFFKSGIDKSQELQCSAFEAAANRIAW